MSREGRRRIFQNLLLSIWAMVTLVLFFCVLLLVYEMIQTGTDPLAMVRSASLSDSVREAEEAGGAAESEPVAPLKAQREVTLYFANPEGTVLVPEVHTVAWSASTVENCRTILQALIAGPRDLLTPVLSADTQVRALYLLENGELVVDFSREVLAAHARFKSASLEALMAYAVVNTVAQQVLWDAEKISVQRVRFLFEGAPPQEIFPGHIDLSAPLQPDLAWVRSVQLDNVAPLEEGSAG